MTASRKMSLALIAVIGALGLVQLVPYGRDRSAPPDGATPPWDSPRTLALAKRACFDCHSHETRWPWYASIAPISWRIASHIREGREVLDFSAFDPSREEVAEAAGEAAETVAEGEMPTFDYVLMHAEARLTPAEKQALIDGLGRTFAAYGERDHADAGPLARPSRRP